MGPTDDQFAKGLANTLKRMSAIETSLLQKGKEELEFDEAHPWKALAHLGWEGFWLWFAFWPTVLGDIGGEAAYVLAEHAAPNHPNIAGAAEFVGSVLASIAGGPEGPLKKLAERYGWAGAVAIVDDVKDKLPDESKEIIEGVEKSLEAPPTETPPARPSRPRLSAEDRAAVKAEARPRPRGWGIWKNYAKDTLAEVPDGPPGFSDEPTFISQYEDRPWGSRWRVYRDEAGKPVAVVKYYKRSTDNSIEISSYVSDQTTHEIGRTLRAFTLLRSFVKDKVVAIPPYSDNTKRMLTLLARYKRMFNVKEDIEVGRRIVFEAAQDIEAEVPVLTRTSKDLREFQEAKQASMTPRFPESAGEAEIQQELERRAAERQAPAPPGLPRIPTTPEQAAANLARQVAESVGFTPEQAQGVVDRILGGQVPPPEPPAVPPAPTSPPAGGGGEPPEPPTPPTPPGGGEPPEPPGRPQTKKEAQQAEGEQAAQRRIAEMRATIPRAEAPPPRESPQSEMQFPVVPTGRQIANAGYKVAKRELGASTNAEVNAKVMFGKGLNKGSRRLYSQFVNMVLWNPRLWTQKALTDLAWQPLQIAFRSLAVGIRFGPTAAERTVEAALYGWRMSIENALRYMAMTFEEERPAFQQDVLNMGTDLVYGLEDLPNQADNIANNHPMLGWTYRYLHAADKIRNTGRLVIMAEDQFAKALAERANMYMNALIEGFYEAEKIGLTAAGRVKYAETMAEWLVEHPTEALIEKAKQQMLEWTFNADGPLIKKITEVANSSILARMGVPFVRVPGNMTKQGLNFTPFAFYVDRAKIFGEDELINGVDKIEAVAKSVIGSALTWIWWDKAARGELHGNGPQGRKRQFWPGRFNPLSIMIGGDYYGYGHLGPLSTYLSLIADAAETYYMSKDPNDQSRMFDAVRAAVANVVGDSEFMRWNTNLLRIITDAKEEGSFKATREYISREIQGLMIPGIVREWAEVHDPGKPVTDVTGPGAAQMNPLLKGAIELWREFANTIPGYNDNRLHDMDIWGNEVYRPVAMQDHHLSTWYTRAANSLAPVENYGGLPPEDPVEKQFWEHHITFDDDYSAVYGKDPRFQVPLPEDQQSEYHKLAGSGKLINYSGNETSQHDAYLDLFNQDWYKAQNFDEQTVTMRQLHESYKNQAKAAIIDKYNYSDAIADVVTREHIPGPTPTPSSQGLFSGLGQPTATPSAVPTPGMTTQGIDLNKLFGTPVE